MSARVRAARPLLWVAVVLSVVWAVAPLAGQTRQTGTAGLRGVVIDADSGAPLQGARVALELEPAGLVSREPPSVGGPVAARRVTTGDDGTYAFEGLPPGRYRLRVERIGYRSTTLEIHYDGPADPRVSVGLEVEPVQLEPVSVVAGRPPVDRAPQLPRDARAADRILAERMRQERFLSGDARVVTDADAFESATLAEDDVLRGLHRLPGVAAEDDWSAEPWVRGGRWDETRIYFDGISLLDPMHLGGAFASVGADAIGSVAFHPGVRPAELGGGTAGVVDLRTRPASTDRPASVLTQLSVLSGRLSLDAPVPGGGVRFAGRRSYIDEVSGSDPGGDNFPYRFYDATLRWDQRVTDRLRLEASALKTGDRVLGDLPHELKGARGSWGNELGRITAIGRVAGLRISGTLGSSTFESRVELAEFDPLRSDLVEAKTAAETWNRVVADQQEITVSPDDRRPGGLDWRAGVRGVETRVDYAGPAPWPFPDAANAGTLRDEARVARTTYWGQMRFPLGSTVDVELGLNLHDPSASGERELDVGPRAHVAWSPSGDLRFTVGAGRHFQFEQALATAGFQMGPALGPGHFWVTARGGIPALRSDIVTAGVEYWVDGGWLLSANLFGRRTDGRMTPAPDSGYVRARPPVESSSLGDGWVEGASTTGGGELSVRRFAGRVSGSASYSYARARTRAAGVEWTTPGAREHVFDAALVLQATDKTRIGGALTLASGAHYTRFYTFRCFEQTWYCRAEDLNDPPVIGFKEGPAGIVSPRHASFDVSVEKTGLLWNRPFGMYVRLKNAFGWLNRTTYVGSELVCPLNDGVTDCTIEDDFEDGMPTLPLFGFWVRW